MIPILPRVHIWLSTIISKIFYTRKSGGSFTWNRRFISIGHGYGLFGSALTAGKPSPGHHILLCAYSES
jgi:hypothetical protein